MTRQKTPPKATNGTFKTRTPKPGLKQAPARARTRKTPALATPEPITYMLTDEEIAQKAYALWEGRGKPLGSQDEDWYRAKEELLAGR